MMKHHLLDELIISIIPICVGEGIRLFREGRPEARLQLVRTQTFEKGLVQLHYQCVD